MLLRVLLAVDEVALQARVAKLLEGEEVFVSTLKDDRLCWEVIRQSPSDIVMVSRALISAPRSEHIRSLASVASGPTIVVLTTKESTEEEAEFVAAGAAIVLSTAVPDDTLKGALNTVLESRRAALQDLLTARRSAARPELEDFVSQSPEMQRFMKTVYRVVDSGAPILVTGETGVGKERLARAIHGASRRGDGPFLSVNCGAIPETLLESQLFGHQKGAFTGATQAQRGCFELAHAGTLFLDEIGEIPFHLQVKLLQALQDYEIQPIGSERKIPVDVRIVAATNRDLQDRIRKGEFRQDLFYRLNILHVEIPPLRQRREDIPTLAMSFLGQLSARIGRQVRETSPEALDLLCRYSWPGNVRELINTLERAVLLCEGSHITADDLPEEIRGPVLATEDADGSVRFGLTAEWLNRPLREAREAVVAEFERAYLSELLKETKGRIAETANRAGIEPRSLFTKMKRYGLRKEDFKPRKS